MRVLVTGGHGQLGTDVSLHCRQAGDTVTTLGHRQLDIADEESVHETVAEVAPHAIINCAAWTAVDECESDQRRAQLANATAVGFLAGVAAHTGAHLVQVSTDYVFDGSKPGEYVETDEPNPQSAYGISKLAGEIAAGPDASIVRTSWLCSAHGGNMVATILRLTATNPELHFVADQRGKPTFTSDLAPALRALAAAKHAGTVHVTNSGTVSWFEFAQSVLSAAGQDPRRVAPIATADLQPKRPAQRPANSALSNDLFASLGYAPLRDHREALAEVVGAYL